LLQKVANAISKNSPDAYIIILIDDERPRKSPTPSATVAAPKSFSSTFDETTERHVQVAEMIIEKASEWSNQEGCHYPARLDTRLAAPTTRFSRTPARFSPAAWTPMRCTSRSGFSAPRGNIEEGGSLTIIATALIETGSRMDEVIFEEFKGTGNMELHLTVTWWTSACFPRINIEKSARAKEENLYHPDEMKKIYILRRALASVPPSKRWK